MDNKSERTRDLLSKFQLEDLLELERELKEAGEENLEGDDREKFRIIRNIINKLESGGPVQEVIREGVHEAVKSSYVDESFSIYDDWSGNGEGAKLVERKRKELYNILENLGEQVRGMDVKEVTAVFSSLLDIQSQLCVEKTEGVIAVRTRLYNFFVIPGERELVRPELKQEISLIFSPEEIHAIRLKLPELAEDDPMKPFYTMVLDQAYDVVQYNEMTGHLLLEMTQYFIQKLVNHGYGDYTKVQEFQQRHSRCKISLKKALDDLRAVEGAISGHIMERPVLLDLPRCLRKLIQIKLGLLDQSHTQKVLQQIYGIIGGYARARAAVAFDFNRLPSYQHGVRLRQSVILNLQKDVLQFTADQFEKEFRAVRDEFNQLLDEIEAQSQRLDPNSPEFEELMNRKREIQHKLETQRRKLDVVRNQRGLVEAQHNMIGDAIQRYQKNEAHYQRLEEELKSRGKDKLEYRKIEPSQAKKPSRMVMARRMREQ